MAKSRIKIRPHLLPQLAPAEETIRLGPGCRPPPAFEWLAPFPWGLHTHSSNTTSTCSVHCSSLHLSHLLFNKPLHFLFLRQFQLIFGNEELIIHSCKGVFDERMVFLSAEQNAYRRIIAFGHDVFLVPVYIGIELAEVFMIEFVNLQFYQYIDRKSVV